MPDGRFLAFLCLGAILLGGVWQSIRRPAPAHSAVARVRSTHVVHPPMTQPPAAPASLVGPEINPPPPARLQLATERSMADGEIVPLEIARVFPSITKPVTDWRKFRPDNLMVEPWPGGRITFTRVALKDEGRFVTWIGRNPALPGASLVGVATASGYDAIMIVPGANEFRYHVRGENVVVTESNAGNDGCGVAPAQLPSASPDSAIMVYDPRYADNLEQAAVYETTITLAQFKVDVLFAYDDDALAVATSLSATDPVGFIDSQCKAAIETCNLILNQSLVTNVAWRYAGLVKAPAYTRTGMTIDDSRALLRGGAIFDWAKSMRYKYGADQLMLIVGGPMDFGGRASSPKQQPVTPDTAAALVGLKVSVLTIAHELAHNFGCWHDRDHVEVISPGVYGPPAPDNDGFWCYGHMWDNPPAPPGFTGSTATSGDIMSYAAWRVPYFSNPNISVHVMGSMFGWPVNLDLGTHQLGQSETAPRAAHAARVLGDNAEAMSNLSEEITALAITQQPQSVTVTRGQALQLSVSATGGGLTYQWQKEGAPINDATASVYSKTASDADAGNYSVVISNLTGSMTSTSASVAVVAPPPPAPPPSSGGGGGGAPSLWFYVFTGALCGGRWLMARRTTKIRTGKGINLNGAKICRIDSAA